MVQKEYIEREEVLRKISKMIDDCKKDYKVNALTALFQVVDTVVGCKPADVQEVVRCKNCKYAIKNQAVFGIVDYKCNLHGVLGFDAEDFCSYGKISNGKDEGE